MSVPRCSALRIKAFYSSVLNNRNYSVFKNGNIWTDDTPTRPPVYQYEYNTFTLL